MSTTEKVEILEAEKEIIEAKSEAKVAEIKADTKRHVTLEAAWSRFAIKVGTVLAALAIIWRFLTK